MCGTRPFDILEEDAMRFSATVMLGGLAVLAACSSAPRGASPIADHKLAPSDMLEVSGAYPLSNGDVLRISQERRRYWAEMRSTGRFEIVPVSPELFVQKGGPIRFKFEELLFTMGVTISGLEAPPSGAGSGIEREFRE
jgi:hypothetical protein